MTEDREVRIQTNVCSAMFQCEGCVLFKIAVASVLHFNAREQVDADGEAGALAVLQVKSSHTWENLPENSRDTGLPEFRKKGKASKFEPLRGTYFFPVPNWNPFFQSTFKNSPNWKTAAAATRIFW